MSQLIAVVLHFGSPKVRGNIRQYTSFRRILMDSSDFWQPSIKDVVKELRKDALSVKNRLQSILYDHHQVQLLCNKWQLPPLIANERCGLWYVAPNEYIETCYFKSTDGHTHNWSFSQRRLNFHLLKLLKSGNIAVVDSTKKGKLMPDALSKTIPIWCAVINSIYFDKEQIEDCYKLLLANNWLWVPSKMVGASETVQIQQLIPGFAREVVAKGLITKQLLEELVGTDSPRKPFVCQWYYPGCPRPEPSAGIDPDLCRTINCVIASKKMDDLQNQMTLRINGSLVQWHYVQGSADDHELWLTKGICDGKLDPPFFWNHIYTNPEIVDPNTHMIHDWLGEEELVSKMNVIWKTHHQQLPAKTNQLPDVTDVKNGDNTTGISFGVIRSSIDYADLANSFPSTNQFVVFSTKYDIIIPPGKKVKVFHYALESGKKSARQLREIFPVLIPQLDTSSPIMVLCEDGSDLSTLLVLILLCQNYDGDWGRYEVTETRPKPNKDTVRHHLRLLLDIRRVNPSRNTLQSVNAYLM